MSPSPILHSFALAIACAVALPAGAAFADVPPPTTSIWGYSGLIVMPTATVHGFRDFSVGLHGLTKAGTLGAAPWATAGIFEGLEAGIVYGIPLTGFTGLSGHAKYQLIKPTKDRPTGVAVGMSMIGVTGTERYIDGNNLYMVLSQDLNAQIGGQRLTFAAVHFGFAGNLSFGARMMAGLELPLGDKAALVGDYLGPLGTAPGFFNVGATFRPFKEWQIRAYSMGVPGAPSWTDRDYGLGIGFTGNMLGNPLEAVASPGARPTSKPTPGLVPKASPTPRLTARPTPAPTPAPSATPSSSPVPTPSDAPSFVPSPTPSPIASEDVFDPNAIAPLHGTLLDDKNRPIAGWTVGVVAGEKWTTTDLKGRYRLELPLGPYELVVRDAENKQQLTKPVRLVTAKGMELPLVVSLPVGEFKGMVIDRSTKQGLGDATLRVFRAGESYNLGSRDNGAFYVGDLLAGEYRVIVTRPRYKPFEGQVTVVARREVSLVAALDPKPGSLAGHVTTLRGQGQPGVTVGLPALKLETATDRLGAYTLPELPPGQHQVIFTQAGKRLATTVVRIRSDETATENVTTSPAAEATADKAGTISGIVTDASAKKPLGGVKIVVEGKDLTVLTITGSDGRFSVADLPPGKYKLQASRPGFQTKAATAVVSAKAGASVAIGLTPLR